MGIKSYHFSPPAIRAALSSLVDENLVPLLLLRHFLVYVGGGEIEEIESRLPGTMLKINPLAFNDTGLMLVSRYILHKRA